ERAGGRGRRREPTALCAAEAADGTRRGDVWLRRDRQPSPEVARRFRAAVERRARGVPFAYAVRSVGFRTLELQIDSRALIPRPETEGLVERGLDWARGAGGGGGGRR